MSVNVSPTASADSSAMFDISGTAKGILIPRTTPIAISSPVARLIVYNIATNTLNYFNGSERIPLCGISTESEAITGSQDLYGVAINVSGALPHHSALLDVASSGKGLLNPRLTDIQRNAILRASGLTICNTTSGSIEFCNCFAWQLTGNRDSTTTIQTGLQTHHGLPPIPGTRAGCPQMIPAPLNSGATGEFPPRRSSFQRNYSGWNDYHEFPEIGI